MSETARTGAMTARDKTALAVLCAAQFMLIVDVVIVNVALPSVTAALGMAGSSLAFTAVAYTVTFGSLLIASGRAGDAWGRRRTFCAGLALFTFASLVTGLTQEPWQFFAARALQGVGAALVSPNALALVLSHFHDTAQRNTAMGIWGAVGAGGAIAGQLLGGLVIDTLGWRWIFLLNVPVGVGATALALALLQESRRQDRRLDLTGAALLCGGLVPAVLAVSWLPQRGLDSPVLTALSAAAALLAGFAVQQRHAAEPLVGARVPQAPGVVVGNLTLAVSAATVTASLFFTTLYMQAVLGHSALAVGLAFAPITVLIMGLAPVAAKLVTRHGARPLLVTGLAVSAAGMLLLARMDPDGSYWTDVLPALVLIALGAALSYAPMFIAATSAVAADDQGAASGLVSTSQELGPALGLAAIAGIASAVAGASGTATAQVSGYRIGLLCAAALTTAAAICASRLPARLGTPADEPAPEPHLSAV